jgi:hypothetical protein
MSCMYNYQINVLRMAIAFVLSLQDGIFEYRHTVAACNEQVLYLIPFPHVAAIAGSDIMLENFKSSQMLNL